ncbi:VHS domain, partial [Dillenia turbinata]
AEEPEPNTKVTKMEKLRLASIGERLKTGGAQMSKRVKEMLQSPTPESKIVDEATLETLSEPNWGLNLRICAMINSDEYSGSEIVKAIKRKLGVSNSRSAAVIQRLSLELLEIIAMNCEKVFSEIASEKVLEEMVRLIENQVTDSGIKERSLQLIRAWGESQDLDYLPVFRQTYMNLKNRNTLPAGYSLESYRQQMSPPEEYPIPDMDLHGADHTTYPFNYGSLSQEEKKEFLEITRNSAELLSSILNSEMEPKHIKDDLTLSMLEKCKQSQPVLERIIQATNDDEGILFEALNLHDELQRVISKYEEVEAASEPGQQLPDKPDTMVQKSPTQPGNEAREKENPEGESSEASSGKSSLRGVEN